MAREVFVLIPTYNCEKFIGKTIDSVLAQTYTDWEALVLDDGSIDNTVEIALAYSNRDNRIRVLKNVTNLGMVNNWNKGISFCNSQYFVKLDGDDIWAPDMLTKSLQVLEHNPEVGLVFSSYVNIDINGEVKKDSRPVLPEFASNKSFSCIPLVLEGSAKMLSYPILRQGVSVMRANLFPEIGNYRFLLTESTQASSDTEFYFRVGCHYKIHCIDEVLYYYRVHGQSISIRDGLENLDQKKIFEVKFAILNYYLRKRRIDKKFWRRNRLEILFRYRLFENYRARKERKIVTAMKHTFRLLSLHPIKTLGHVIGRITTNE